MVHCGKICKRAKSVVFVGTVHRVYRISFWFLLVMKRMIEAHTIAASILQAQWIWFSPFETHTYITKGFFEIRQKKESQRKNVGDRDTPSPYFITLVSAICPIATSPLIQQSNKLDWKRFIAYNSFMRALPMHWDVTALGGLIGLRGHLWGDVRHEEWPFAKAALQQLLQLYTSVLFCNILVKLYMQLLASM